MAKYALVVDPESLERRYGAPTVGVVHLLFGSKAFPARDWSDFALEFLGDYVRAVLLLRKRKRSSVSFFEGPHELRFRRDGEVVHVEAISEGTVIHSAEMPFAHLLEQTMADLLPFIEHEEAARA
jgi:hypothetical protein